MDKLNVYRKEIDKIDKELVGLFEKRLEVVSKVARYKKENNLPVYYEDREKVVIQKVEENIVNKDYLDEANKFFKYIMEISKSFQIQNNSKE
ncbi:chorismate mutase [Clostridioides mangenotii]|uniref:chorismate mutase n=1 Tax=Metaclostridioides mangenotii TaxID=1540 RepID=UPI00214A08E0|nr:chorismate mutase [Clostridioides mangenotii]MCR1954264.1 chorismate mutase [Clostridioides mangenotii]